MYKPTWLNTKITGNQQPAVAIKQWSAIKLFYRQHMPYARLAQKESVAVIHHVQPTLMDHTELNQQIIIAAIRVKPIGKYQLINGLLVHPDYRGQHISTQLLQFIATELIVKDCFLFAHPWLVNLYRQQHFIVRDLSELSSLPAEITQLYHRYNSKKRPLILMQLSE